MSSKIPSVKETPSRGVIERKKRSQVMCRDKVCFLDFVVVPDCYVYLYTNDTNCDIPCQVSGCQKELHHFISCPIWTCNDLTTTLSTSTSSTTARKTTSGTTTTSASTTTTIPDSPTTLIPPFPSFDHPGYLYSSIVLNAFLFLCIIYMLLKKCKKAIARRIRNFRNRNTQGYQNVDQSNEGRTPPIVRNQPRQFLPLAPNHDHLFVLDDLESELDSENSPLLRRVPVSSSPRVPSFLNTPTDSVFVRASGQTENINLRTFQPRGIFRTRSNPPSFSNSGETIETAI